ncbi:MAG TPA: hypothetical protein VI359_05000 [Nitrospiraceae bacterium]
MASPLTVATIESAIAAMPVQGRIMLRLILLQYLDVTQEEIEYMAADRPDPRCVTGTKPTHNMITKEAIKAVRDKRDEYRRSVRLLRERTWLQCECLKQLASLHDAMANRAGQLLLSRFGQDRDALDALRAQARTALPKPAIRALDRRWDADEITAEEYQRQRLAIELQTHLRLAERYRKRLDLAERERQTASNNSLQDHEIGHIWGIPAGSLAARKVKYLAQYLQMLQTLIQREAPAKDTVTPPLDLWKETFSVLAQLPVERSLSTYDGLERTESALLDKLASMVWGSLTEEVESKFWLSLVHGGTSNALLSEWGRSLFGLQRLAAILAEVDTSSASLEEALLTRIAPRTKTEPGALLEEKPAEPVLGEMGEHVLRSMLGESHPDLHGSRRS